MPDSLNLHPKSAHAARAVCARMIPRRARSALLLRALLILCFFESCYLFLLAWFWQKRRGCLRAMLFFIDIALLADIFSC